MKLLLITAVLCALPVIRANSAGVAAGMKPFIYVPDIRTLEDALVLYENSFLNGSRHQYLAACEYLEGNFTTALRNPRISRMNGYAFVDLIGQPWKTEEIEVFYAVGSWLGAHPNVTRDLAASMKSKIHLVAMNPDQLYEIVQPSRLIADRVIVEALAIKAWRLNDTKYIRFSNQLARTNVLVDTNGTTDVLMGRCHVDLFKRNADFCHSDATNKTIIFRSTAGYTINFISFKSQETATLDVQLSSDGIQWKTVATESSSSSGPRTLRFPPLSVRYYKLITKVQSSVRIDSVSAYLSI